MRRILDAFEGIASSLIRATFLAAGVTAIAVYFGAGEMPAWVMAVSNFFLPWLLAFSLETQAYLAVRAISALRKDLRAPALRSDQRKNLKMEAREHLTILAFLTAFSVWNQYNYLVETWTPPHNGLPPVFNYAVRALVVPLAFMGSAWVAPTAMTFSGRIVEEAHHTLDSFLKVLKKQRKQAISKAAETNADLVPAITTVSQAAGEDKAGQMIADIHAALQRIGQEHSDSISTARPTPPKPPRGGQSPALHVVDDHTPRMSRAEVENRARHAYRTGMSVQDLQRAAQISPSSAVRWHKRLTEETSAGRKSAVR